MQDKDYYQLFGININASFEDIKLAYHKKAREYHPDSNPSKEAEIMFKKINEAYKVLSDPVKRNEYNKEQGYNYSDSINIQPINFAPEENYKPSDTPRKVVLNNSMTGSKEEWDALKAKQAEPDLKIEHKIATTTDIKALQEKENEEEAATAWGISETPNKRFSLKSAFGILDFFKKNAQAKRAEFNKQEFKQRIKEASTPLPPTKTKKSHPRPPKTDKTNESGIHPLQNILQSERIFQFGITSIQATLGTEREIALQSSEVNTPKRIRINIPKGLKHNTLLEVSKGWESVKLRVNVVPSTYFRISELDIILFLPITLMEAINGFETEISTLDRKYKINVPSIQENKSPIILSGYGLEDISNNSRGNIIVETFIVSPDSINDSLLEAADFIQTFYTQHPREGFAQQLSSQKQGLTTEFLNVFITTPVTFPEILTGTSFDLPTEYGLLKVQVPNNWHLQKKILFKEIGLIQLDSKDKGDIVVLPKVGLPTTVNSEFIEAAKAIEAYYQTNVRAWMPSNLQEFC